MALFKRNTYISKLRKSTIDYVEKILASTEKKAALKGLPRDVGIVPNRFGQRFAEL